MADHSLTDNFQSFFGNLNPSTTTETVAAREYAAVKALIEDRNGGAAVLEPSCFLQGSYKQQTAIYTLHDIDIVALCRLWQPGSPGDGPSWGRDQIFATIAQPLVNSSRYRGKIRYGSSSMCIKIDNEMRLEVLPVVYAAGNNDYAHEPFRLYRPETAQWADGFARYHQQCLTWKNGADNTNGNFIPAVKVLKHIRSKFGYDAVSFHIECLLFSLPDTVFLGGPADYISQVLTAIASTTADCLVRTGNPHSLQGSRYIHRRRMAACEVAEVSPVHCRLRRCGQRCSAGKQQGNGDSELADTFGKRLFSPPMIRKILSIDGGGIKGVFPAAFLASLETTLGVSVADYFDLIVGTSTGGIIALALGAGLTAGQVLEFYETKGPSIFAGNRLVRLLRRVGMAKYSSEPLRSALLEIFGERRLADSQKRLVIPSANLETGKVHIYKTQHHPRLQTDHRERMVDVALATTAAPTYFPTHALASGIPLIDGGVWANNPVGFAVVEALSMLDWRKEELRVLSLGCATEVVDASGAWHSMGAWYWGRKIVDVFMTTQSSASLGVAQHLAGHENVTRISPLVGANRFALDNVSNIGSLKGLGVSEAREALPRVSLFFETLAPAFTPIKR